MIALGIDIGATWIKSAVLCPEQGTLVDVRKTPFPKPLPNLDERVVEVATADIWVALLGHLSDREGITDLFICNQMAGFVPMELGSEKGGWPRKWIELGNFVSCWDRRCSAYRRTSDMMTHWQDGVPYKGPTVNLGDWLVTKLVPSHDATRVHPSNWCAVDHETFHNGPMCQTHNEVKKLGRWEGFGIDVWRPVGDHAASVHGCELGPDELSVNLGTGGQVSMIDYGWGEGPRLHQVRPGIGCQLQCVTHLPAGAWLKGRCGEPPYSGMTKAEQAVVKWVGHAARNLRPFSGAALSGSVAAYLAGAIEAELLVPCRVVEDAALRGLLRIAKGVSDGPN